MSVADRVIPSVHREEAKKVINEALKGYLHRIRPTGADYVICVYERPDEMQLAGGKTLYMPQTASRLTEDKFQGIVGLIVKAGPNVRKREYAEFFDNEEPPKIGDWVAFRTQDGWPFILGSRSMRLVQANFIRMILADPDCVL